MSYSEVGWLRRLRQEKLDKPKAATMGDWGRWRNEAARNHPVWYFLLESLPDFVSGVLRAPVRWLSNLKYEIMYRIHPKHRYHILKVGKPGYYDPCSLFLPANFALLERYIEERDGVYEAAKRIEWLRENREGEWDDTHIWHETEALSLWLWWTLERPARVDPWDSVGEPEERAGEGHDWTANPDKMVYSRRQYGMIHELEAIYERDDEEQLIRLIKIREYLWA